MTVLDLPWPPASLSGHAEGHWRSKSGPTAKWRAHARYIAQAAKIPKQPDGDILIRITFNPPDRRGDRVNFAIRIKPIIDGIADAMDVNDSRFLPEYVFGPVVKGGSVRIEIGIDRAVNPT